MCWCFFFSSLTNFCLLRLHLIRYSIKQCSPTVTWVWILLFLVYGGDDAAGQRILLGCRWILVSVREAF